MSALIQRPTVAIAFLAENQVGPFLSPAIQLPVTAAYNIYAFGDYAASPVTVEWTIDVAGGVYLPLLVLNNLTAPGIVGFPKLDDSMSLRVSIPASTVTPVSIGFR